MKNPEAIFTIIFIVVILLIPFGIGANLSRALRKRKDVETLFSDAKYCSGHVIGYTKRKYDSENTGDYYPILEYGSDKGKRIWAEGESCDKDEFSISSKVELLVHPLDERYVTFVLTRDLMRVRAGFEKNLEVFINIVATVFVISCVVYYKKYALSQLVPLLLSYLLGFVFGIIFSGRKTEDKVRLRHSRDRHNRLITAQQKNVIPCYLEE